MTSYPAPPAPLDWHPAYREHTDLIDWLEDRGPYAEKDFMVLPVPIQATYYEEPSEYTLPRSSIKVVVLHKTRCVGLAPYVGEPFYYWWWGAHDDAGRWIAGDSHIRYPDEWENRHGDVG